LDFLKGGDEFLVGFDVVFVPLEGGADEVDVVLEFVEDSAHGFLRAGLYDVDESVHFLFEDNEVTPVADELVDLGPHQAYALVRNILNTLHWTEH